MAFVSAAVGTPLRAALPAAVCSRPGTASAATRMQTRPGLPPGEDARENAPLRYYVPVPVETYADRSFATVLPKTWEGEVVTIGAPDVPQMTEESIAEAKLVPLSAVSTAAFLEYSQSVKAEREAALAAYVLWWGGREVVGKGENGGVWFEEGRWRVAEARRGRVDGEGGGGCVCGLGALRWGPGVRRSQRKAPCGACGRGVMRGVAACGAQFGGPRVPSCGGTRSVQMGAGVHVGQFQAAVPPGFTHSACWEVPGQVSTRACRVLLCVGAPAGTRVLPGTNMHCLIIVFVCLRHLICFMHRVLLAFWGGLGCGGLAGVSPNHRFSAPPQVEQTGRATCGESEGREYVSNYNPMLVQGVKCVEYWGRSNSTAVPRVFGGPTA